MRKSFFRNSGTLLLSLVLCVAQVPIALADTSPDALSAQDSELIGTAAVGDTFISTVSVGGVDTSCTFKITSATTVQMGDGTAAAISTSASGDVVIPSTVTYGGSDYSVTALADYCFYKCTSLTSTGLATNSTVTSLGVLCFYGCTSLTSTGLATNTTLTSLGNNYCFYGCTSLTSTGLESNSTVTSLSANCFNNCTALTSTGLATNSTITSVSTYCFAHCTALTSTDLATNSTVTSIGVDSFYGCVRLTSTGLATNSTVTSLEPDCFFGTAITSTGLATNSTVTSLGGECFGSCTSLTSTGLESNTTVTSLSESCFIYCSSLTSTGLATNSTVTSLGNYCFRSCGSLTGDLIIPAQITSIGVDAFTGTNYTRIYLIGTALPTLGSSCFSFKAGQAVMYVPAAFTGGTSVTDSTYTYATSDSTLVYKDPSTISSLTLNLTSSTTGTVSFTLSKAATVVITDSTGATLFSSSEAAGSNNVSLTNISSAATTLTLTTQCIYPSDTATASYNVSDTSSALVDIPIDISSATIEAMADQTWTGSAITPRPTVTLNGEILEEGSDYDLSYTDNTDVGTAAITITGEGKYTGAISTTFRITMSSITDATFSKTDKKLYIGSALTPTPTLTLGSTVLTSGTDYTLSYSDNATRGTATVTAAGTGNYTDTASTTFEVVVLDDLDYTQWYCADGWLSYVVENDLMSGYSDTYDFGPLDNITRGQVAVILYRYACTQDSTLETAYGSTTDSSKYATTAVFSDEATGVYYTAAINWAKAVGIMTGDTSTGYATVRPNDSITREDLATMVYRYVEEAEPTLAATEGSVDYSSIQGMDSVDSWALTAVKWCASYGILGGVEENGVYYMDPTDTAWRASMAKMVTVTLRDILG
jgi:hypothetical protein